MAKRSGEESFAQFRVSIEARRLARIAAGFLGMSPNDYASALIIEGAKRDIAEGARLMGSRPVKGSRASAKSVPGGD